MVNDSNIFPNGWEGLYNPIFNYPEFGVIRFVKLNDYKNE